MPKAQVYALWEQGRGQFVTFEASKAFVLLLTRGNHQKSEKYAEKTKITRNGKWVFLRKKKWKSAFVEKLTIWSTIW